MLRETEFLSVLNTKHCETAKHFTVQLEGNQMDLNVSALDVSFNPPDVPKIRRRVCELVLPLLRHTHVKSHVKYKPDPSASPRAKSHHPSIDYFPPTLLFVFYSLCITGTWLRSLQTHPDFL